MKILIFLFTAVFSSNAAAYNSPTSYSDAQNRLQETSWAAYLVHKDLKKNTDEQVSNYHILNQLRQAKIKAEEMRQRENITAAVKVADLGLTAAGIVTGGMALAAKEGGKAALKWYFAKKIAIEGAKEAAGVPGYSDAVKVGFYIFNKADERDIKADLGRENMEILARAQKIFETQGTTLQEKNLELNKLIFEMEDRVEKKDYYLKACVKRLEELKNESELLEKDAARRKAEEEKKSAEMKKNIKEIDFQPPLSDKNQTATEVPTPPAKTGETEEDKRARIQKAIDAYINSLSKQLSSLNEQVREKFYSIKSPSGLTFDAMDGVRNFFDSSEYIKKTLDEADTYMKAQSVEENSHSTLENLMEIRSGLVQRENGIKDKIEPLIKDMAEKISLWKGVYSKYSPSGFSVPKAPELRQQESYETFYIKPMSYSETFIKGSEGLESVFSSLESAAKSRKNAIYSQVSQFASSYGMKIKDFKSYGPQTEKKILELLEKAGKEGEPANNLPHYFQSEFTYSGKNDLKNLKARVDEANSAATSAAALYRNAAVLYADLIARQSELYSMSQDPSYYEISSIAYSSNDPSHKKSMDEALKNISNFSLSSSLGTVEPQKHAELLMQLAYSGRDGLNWLESQKQKIISAYTKAASAFSSAASADFSPLYSNTAALKDKINSLNSIFARAEEEKDKLIQEARIKSFFGEDEPVLKNTGFWDPEISKKIQEAEKVRDDFWASAKGQEIYNYARIAELRQTQDEKNPELPMVRKLYDDLKSAYESRNASAVAALLSQDWTSPEGEDAAELREYLNSIFKMFNEVSFNISNLSIVSQEAGVYSVSYNLEIRSKIYDKNIKREEKSSVYEKVKFENGKPKIFKTENGSYWQIK